jgi:hypothetical protein
MHLLFEFHVYYSQIVTNTFRVFRQLPMNEVAQVERLHLRCTEGIGGFQWKPANWTYTLYQQAADQGGKFPRIAWILAAPGWAPRCEPFRLRASF